MEIAKLVLEYLKVIVSPQLVVGGIILTFFRLFPGDIKALMQRLAKVRLPGGAELSMSQPPPGQIPSTTPDSPQVPEGLSLTPDQVQTIRQLFQAERARATLWEYRYLNYFLVPATQAVLNWLASLNERTTVSFFDTLWLPFIPSAEQRTAIISALQAHHLIQLTGDLIEVTPKGREYIRLRGPLPLRAT